MNLYSHFLCFHILKIISTENEVIIIEENLLSNDQSEQLQNTQKQQ